VLFVGDSVSMTLAEGLNSSARSYGLNLTNDAILGCGIVRGGPFRYFGSDSQQPRQCENWPDRWTANLTKTDPDVVALLVGRWEVMDRVHDGRWTHVGDPAFDTYLASELDRAVQVLSAKGALVAMFTAPYYLRGERPDGGMWPEDATPRVDAFNLLVRQVAARHPSQVALIDLNAQTSSGGHYVNSLKGVRLRYDGVHFTTAGARWLAPWLLPQLNALVPGRGAATGATTTTTAPRSSSSERTPTTVARRPATPTTTIRRSTTTSSPPPTSTTTTTTTTPRPTTSTTLIPAPKPTTTTTSGPKATTTTTPTHGSP
jgi:hypothetical protein